MKYLVTGAAGFIGMYTAKRLLEQGHQVIGLDSLKKKTYKKLAFSTPSQSLKCATTI